MKSKGYVLVKARKYNNSANVLFVMDSDDFRIGDGNYDPIGEGKFVRGYSRIDGDLYKSRRFSVNGVLYKVFHDRSAKIME